MIINIKEYYMFKIKSKFGFKMVGKNNFVQQDQVGKL